MPTRTTLVTVLGFAGAFASFVVAAPTQKTPVAAATPKVAATAASQKVELSELVMLDVRGTRHTLAASPSELGTVFIFLSSECPISRQYIPELNRLAQAAGSTKVNFYGVLSDPSVTRTAAARFADEFQLGFPLLFDASQELAALFHPRNVPEAFLVDATGTVRYSGRIDDFYADIDKKKTQPSRRDLLEAMTALAAGKTVAIPQTEPIGCPFEGVKADPGKTPVTYTRDIAPIRVFAHCAECHHPGEAAPFALLSYQPTRQAGTGARPSDGPAAHASLESRHSLRQIPGRAAADGAANRPH